MLTAKIKFPFHFFAAPFEGWSALVPVSLSDDPTRESEPLFLQPGAL
jgi:hypothetical protein